MSDSNTSFHPHTGGKSSHDVSSLDVKVAQLNHAINSLMYFTYQLQEQVNGRSTTGAAAPAPAAAAAAPATTGGSYYDSILSDLRETEVRGGNSLQTTEQPEQLGGGIDEFDRFFIDSSLMHSSNKSKTQRQLKRMGFSEKAIISSRYW